LHHELGLAGLFSVENALDSEHWPAGLFPAGSQERLIGAAKPPAAAIRFRTIQVYPNDLSILMCQVERGGDPTSKREGRAMDERTIDRTPSWISDTHAMALYSTLLFLVMVLWVYVPARVIS
jgi:hypothetical protein